VDREVTGDSGGVYFVGSEADVAPVTSRQGFMCTGRQQDVPTTIPGAYTERHYIDLTPLKATDA
jgi:hypothetical protein